MSPSRRLALFGAASGGFALLTAQPSAARTRQEHRLRHAAGETVLAGSPSRVAVFDLAALDVIDALGAPVAAVPGMRFPASLARYDDAAYAKVGTLFEPDYDALRAARPDLIIVGGRSASKYVDLSAIAPTVSLSTSTTGFIASVVYNILLLGRVFDRQTEASALSERLLADIAALHGRTQGQTALVLFAVGAGLLPQAPYSRFGVIYELLGMEPVVAPFDLPPTPPRGEAETRSEADRARAAQEQATGLTTALGRDPDWLFVLDRASATGGEAAAPRLLAANPTIAASRATREGRVVQLDAPGWYLIGGGPTNLGNSIVQITAALGAR